MARASTLVRSPSSAVAVASCLAAVVMGLVIHVAAVRPANADRPTTGAMHMPLGAAKPQPYTERGPGTKTYDTQFIAPEIFENLDERFAKHTENEGRDALISLAKDLYTTAHGERTSLETAVDDVRGLNPLLRNADHDAEAAEKAADVLAKDGIRAMHKGSARNQASIDSAADILKQGHKSVYEGVTRHEGHLFAKQGYTSNVHGQDNTMPSQLQQHVESSPASKKDEEKGGGRLLPREEDEAQRIGDARAAQQEDVDAAQQAERAEGELDLCHGSTCHDSGKECDAATGECVAKTETPPVDGPK